MPDDPIVEEIHRIREQMLAEAGGTLEGLLQSMRERHARGEFADREFIRLPPKAPQIHRKRAAG